MEQKMICMMTTTDSDVLLDWQEGNKTKKSGTYWSRKSSAPSTLILTRKQPAHLLLSPSSWSWCLCCFLIVVVKGVLQETKTYPNADGTERGGRLLRGTDARAASSPCPWLRSDWCRLAPGVLWVLRPLGCSPSWFSVESSQSTQSFRCSRCSFHCCSHAKAAASEIGTMGSRSVWLVECAPLRTRCLNPWPSAGCWWSRSYAKTNTSWIERRALRWGGRRVSFTTLPGSSDEASYSPTRSLTPPMCTSSNSYDGSPLNIATFFCCWRKKKFLSFSFFFFFFWIEVEQKN